MQQTDRQSEKKYTKVYRLTLKSALVNAVLLAVKFVAGIVGCSYAMVADALHSTADFMQDVLAVLYLRMGRRDKDDSHDYGYGRYATVSTLLVAVLLFAVGTYIVVRAIVLIVGYFENEESIHRPAWFAFAAAVVCIGVKGALYLLVQKRGKSLDSRFVSVNAERYRLDVFSSTGTAVAICFAALLSAKWRILDPVAALIVALFILRMASLSFRNALDELLDKSLPEKTEKEIAAIARSVAHIDEVVRVLTRRVGGKVAIELVVNMNGRLSLNQVHKSVLQVEDLLEERFKDVAHLSVHVDPTPDVQNEVG